MDSNNMNQFENNDVVQPQQNATYTEMYQQPVQQYQQTYQQPVPQQQLEVPMSVGDWMITMLIMCIPCVNIIMMFVWAFGNSDKKSKANYFKATLIWCLISVGLSIVIAFILTAVMGVSIGALSGMGY